MFTFRQLETFREVMRARTTIGAASALRISQPAVSNTIRQMEDRAGFPLFERLGNRLVPTPDAEEIYRDSEAIFTLYAAFNQRIDMRKRSQSGSLRLVITPPVANALIPRALGEFLTHRPAIGISVDTRRVDGVLEAIETRMADIGFALNPPEREGIQTETIALGEMVCCFRPGHRLEARERITAEDLKAEKLILFEPESSLDRAMADIVDKIGRGNVVAEVRYSSVACLMAEAGLGVTLADTFTAVHGGRYRLTSRPLSPPQRVALKVLTRRGEPAKRIQTVFLAELARSEALATLLAQEEG
ncbi:MAG: LysR family transcriptional regulator [Pseudorhodobacter sp.]